MHGYAVCFYAEDGSEYTPDYPATKREAVKTAKSEWATGQYAGVFVFTVGADNEIECGYDPIWFAGHV